MCVTLNSDLLHRSFLMRLLQTTGLSFALLTASAAAVRAEDVTVQGVDGANGADGVNPGQPGFPADPTFANASSADSLNEATAVGGNGGEGGNGATFSDFGGAGGNGGDATATAATIVISGSAGAGAAASGGNGGNLGFGNPGFSDANGGFGGAATAIATGSSGNGSASVSASATGSSGTMGYGEAGFGGDANASSTAKASGSGDASSSATATGGAGAFGDDIPGSGGNATTIASASATGGGKAIATAVATSGIGRNIVSPPGAQATSSAETVNGAMAQALSTATSTYYGQGSSTAKTSFEGVSVQSKAIVQVGSSFFDGPATTGTSDAIAQGGSGQTFVDLGERAAIATALPDKAFATTLIGGASNVADTLLGPGDEIFGAAILQGAEFEVIAPSSTFDFSFRGDLILGVIADGGFDISVNGTDIPSEDTGDNSVVNLGSNFGSNIDLTIEGDGVFVLGSAVPEPSTWAMTLLGFAGLGFAG